MTERRIELITYLLKEKPWDFAYVAFVGPDRLQHSLWGSISALDRRATEYFRLLDYGLGMVLEQLGPDDALFVVSDHGFQGVNKVFSINEYLYTRGLLKPGSLDQLQRAQRAASFKHLLKQVGLIKLARKTKRTLKHAGAIKPPLGDVYHPEQDHIDLEHTTAYVPSLSGYPGSFADIVFKEGTEIEVVAELREDLQRQVDPRSGKALASAIYTNEVFGEGPYAPREPHLLLLPEDGITFRMELGSKWLWSDTSDVRGTHQKDGVLYAYGGGIKQGFQAPNAEICDLVPTVLHSMDLPLPHAFDGRVLDELFTERKLVTPVENARSGNGVVQRRLGKLLEK